MASKPTKFLFGTCAGLIMLSNDVENVKEGGQVRIGGLEIVASRNSYGRQRESFEQNIILKNSQLINCFGGNTGLPSFEGVFIRAPKIIRITDLNRVQGEFFNCFNKFLVIIAKNFLVEFLIFLNMDYLFDITFGRTKF